MNYSLILFIIAICSFVASIINSNETISIFGWCILISGWVCRGLEYRQQKASHKNTNVEVQQ